MGFQFGWYGERDGTLVRSVCIWCGEMGDRLVLGIRLVKDWMGVGMELE